MSYPPEVVEFFAKLERGRDDIIYFAKEILGVDVNPAQERWFRLLGQMDGHEWFYRRVLHVAANQIGKTLGLSIAILWANTYKKGLKLGNWDYWLSTPYKWLHVGPTHPISLYTRDDISNLVKGAHPAQFDRETGEKRRVLWPAGFAKETKFDEGQYPGFKLFNGAEIHFRTTADKAKGIQGIRAHGVSFDEAAFEDFLLLVLNQTIKMRLASTSGPLWIVSTPNGINDYYELVMSIQQASGGPSFHERVWEAPKKREALVWSHITDNVGFGFTQAEVDFLEEDVDQATKEQALRGAFLTPVDAFFVPAKNILKSWVKGLRDQPPKVNHKYVIFWDPSVSGAGDPTVCVIIDVTKKPWRGVSFRRWEKPMTANQLIEEMHATHLKWNTAPDNSGFAPRAITGFDSTSMGGKILDQQIAQISPKRPVNFGGPKAKINMLTNMRAALSRHDVWIPETWLRLQREVLNYRLDDKKLVQDSVMAFAGALSIAASGWGGASSRPFNNSYRVAPVRR